MKNILVICVNNIPFAASLSERKAKRYITDLQDKFSTNDFLKNASIQIKEVPII
jgi:hypothetical protein